MILPIAFGIDSVSKQAMMVMIIYVKIKRSFIFTRFLIKKFSFKYMNQFYVMYSGTSTEEYFVVDV